MLVTVCDLGKALGSTTIAAGLAAAFASVGERARSCLIEADPRGGDLAALQGLDPSVGVLSLAATSTPEAHWDVIERHSSPAPGTPGLRVVPLASHGTNLVAQLRALWTDVGPVLTSIEETAVVDVGRFDGDAASVTPLWLADTVIAVCGGDAAGLVRAHHGLQAEVFADPKLRVIPVVNGSPWDLAEIRSTIGLDAATVLDWNAKAATVIRAGHWHPVRRSHLCRQLAALAEQIRRPTTTAMEALS